MINLSVANLFAAKGLLIHTKSSSVATGLVHPTLITSQLSLWFPNSLDTIEYIFKKKLDKVLSEASPLNVPLAYPPLTGLMSAYVVSSSLVEPTF